MRGGPVSALCPTRHHLLTVSSSIASPAATARGPRAWWLGLAPARRRLLRALFAAGIVLVLLVGGLLARFLSVENAERAADLALIQAEVTGNTVAMLEQLSGCRHSTSCVAAVKANAGDPQLRRAGAVKILQLESKTAYSLFGATGKTRLAWTVIGSQPVVQCVNVRRTGNILAGIHVHVIGLSVPIDNEGTCWKLSKHEVEEEEDTAVER
jgi:hypothetical protein